MAGHMDGHTQAWDASGWYASRLFISRYADRSCSLQRMPKAAIRGKFFGVRRFVMSGSGRMFTLVEMLVILAIIVALMALLMPALRHSLGIARQTACAGNQRQIAAALLTYKDDNYGFIPSPISYVWQAGAGSQVAPWALFLFRPKYGPVGNQAQMLPGGYINEEERLTLVCPASASVEYLRPLSSSDWNYRGMGQTYGMYYMGSDVWVAGYDESKAIALATFYLNGEAKGAWRYYRYNLLPGPSKYALISDTSSLNTDANFGRNGSVFYSRVYGGSYAGVWLCHEEAANILCADGHVDNGTPNKMPTYENSKYKSGGVLTKGIGKFSDQKGNLMTWF